MRRVCLVLVLLLLHCVVCSEGKGSLGHGWELGTPSYCPTNSEADAAEYLFQTHKSNVQDFFLQLKKERDMDDLMSADALFAEAGLTQFKHSKFQCLIRLHYSVNTREVVVGEPRFQNENACKTFVYNIRTRVYQRVLNWIASDNEKLGIKLDHDFEFFIDITDGTQGDGRFYAMLGLPLLTMARSPSHSAYILPIPDLHTFYALAQSGQRSVPQLRRSLPENVRRFAEDTYKMFAFRFPDIPWENKTSKVMYRATCTPTIYPVLEDAQVNGESWLYVPTRADICGQVMELPNKDMYDVGFLSDDEDGCDTIVSGYSASTELMGFCMRCKECLAQRVKRENMMGYKYLLNSDGYAFTFDALFWKMASGSVVFQVNSKDTPGELTYENWYSPLLRPNENYIPVSPTTMTSAVASCVKNEQRCKRIAEEARKTVRCNVTLNVARQYLGKVLQLLHDTH